MYLKTLLFMLAVACAPIAKAGDKGSSQVNLGAGIITLDEFNGVTYTSYMDIPGAYSGALFMSYRYFVTDHFAVGLSFGTDDVKGNLTEGNPNFNNTGMSGTVGAYIRHTYTIAAPELFLKYSHRGNTMLYGYIGAAYTFSKVEKAYDPQIYANAYQNGVNTGSGLPEYLSPVNPTYTTENHFNGQVTPLGVRTGNKVACYFELGFGYKGIVSAGISIKL